MIIRKNTYIRERRSKIIWTYCRFWTVENCRIRRRMSTKTACRREIIICQILEFPITVTWLVACGCYVQLKLKITILVKTKQLVTSNGDTKWGCFVLWCRISWIDVRSGSWSVVYLCEENESSAKNEQRTILFYVLSTGYCCILGK